MQVIKSLLMALLLCFAGVAGAVAQVDINAADAGTLSKDLKGIGPKKAAAIVEYRQKHGPYKSADDLAQVKGISKKLVDMNRDAITVGTAAPAPHKGAVSAQHKPAVAK